MTEPELDQLALDLSTAWQSYSAAFGEPPHGTQKQLRAMLCFVPKTAPTNQDSPA
jgi:hypothetical protein